MAQSVTTTSAGEIRQIETEVVSETISAASSSSSHGTLSFAVNLQILFAAFVLCGLCFSSSAAAAGPAAGGGSLAVLAIDSKPSVKKAQATRRSAVATARKPKAEKVASRVKKRAAVKYVVTGDKGKVIRYSKVRRTSVSLRGKRKTVESSVVTETPYSAEEAKIVRPKIEQIPAITLNSIGAPEGLKLQTLIDAADFAGHVRDSLGNTISLTIDQSMQQTAEGLLLRWGVPWGSIVAMDPRSGAIRAIASHSAYEPGGEEVALRGGFPAASLFKIVTATAAVERAGMEGDDMVAFRGGNYTLTHANYNPDQARDRRQMSLAEALGRSCNPVFARVALQNFSPTMLQRYAKQFGFNQELGFDVPLAQSVFTLPDDHYEFARTAAGFGEVTTTPVHAAAMLSGLANNGVMMRPHIITQIVDGHGKPMYSAKSVALRNVARPETARAIMDMMQSTVEIGTARRQFRGSALNNIPIAAKTGTLSGQNPKGVYHWFVAAVPSDAPEMVIAVLVINPGRHRSNSVQIGRQFLERTYLAREKDKRIESTREQLPEETPAGVS